MLTDPLIFLDIDGVLNTHKFDHLAKSNTIDREKVGRLNLILQVTGAKIVLSSAWRYHYHRGEMNLAGLDWLLRTHGVMAGPDKDHPRVIGVTRPDTMIGDKPLPDERGQQITDWRREHQHTGPYVVIDDGGFRPSGQWTDLGISRSGHPVVFVSNVLALTLVDVEIAINVLTGS